MTEQIANTPLVVLCLKHFSKKGRDLNSSHSVQWSYPLPLCYYRTISLGELIIQWSDKSVVELVSALGNNTFRVAHSTSYTAEKVLPML